jgi:TusA-related sulfurtransferase
MLRRSMLRRSMLRRSMLRRLDTLPRRAVRWPRVSTPNASSPVAVARTVDCRGLFCPMPIVHARDALRALAVGDILELLADDPASDADMRSWAGRTGHELVAATKDGAVHRFLVRKAR